MHNLYPDSTKQLHGYSTLSTKSKQMVNKVLFPNLVNDQLRYQLFTFNYNISQISWSNLISELHKRDISIFDVTGDSLTILSYNSLLNKFQQFLDSTYCTKSYTKLIYGFCHVQMKQANISYIPFCFIMNVLKYGKPYYCT